jgi:hypothetical protein
MSIDIGVWHDMETLLKTVEITWTQRIFGSVLGENISHCSHLSSLHGIFISEIYKLGSICSDGPHCVLKVSYIISLNDLSQTSSML